MVSTILILALIGIAALLAELVLPGGILGIAGGLCLIAAAVMSFMEWGFIGGAIVTLTLLVLSFTLFRLWMKYFHLLPGTRKLVLHDEIDAGDGMGESIDLTGQKGIAATEIAPSGRATCSGERFDVMAESIAISKGSEIVFLKKSGPSWVVRQA